MQIVSSEKTDNIVLEPNVLIYPNPTVGEIAIYSADKLDGELVLYDMFGGVARVTVFELNGKFVVSEKILSQLGNGTIFYQYIHEGKMDFGKFIKKS